jgi:hypothetical protein
MCRRVWASWSLPERGSRLVLSNFFPADFMPAVILSSRVSARWMSLQSCRETTLVGMSDVERRLPSSVMYLRMSFGRPDRMSRN